MHTQSTADLQSALELNLALRRDLAADVAVRTALGQSVSARGTLLLWDLDLRIAELRTKLCAAEIASLRCEVQA